MKSIKEKSEEYLQQEKDEILCVYDRYAGFVDGANYVLDHLSMTISVSEDGYLLDNIKKMIEQLKK